MKPLSGLLQGPSANTECSTQIHLPFHSKHTLAVDFQGGQLTSDAGLLLLGRAEAKVGLIKAMAQAIQEIPREILRDVVQLGDSQGRCSIVD